MFILINIREVQWTERSLLRNKLSFCKSKVSYYGHICKERFTILFNITLFNIILFNSLSHSEDNTNNTAGWKPAATIDEYATASCDGDHSTTSYPRHTAAASSCRKHTSNPQYPAISTWWNSTQYYSNDTVTARQQAGLFRLKIIMFNKTI